MVLGYCPTIRLLIPKYTVRSTPSNNTSYEALRNSKSETNDIIITSRAMARLAGEAFFLLLPLFLLRLISTTKLPTSSHNPPHIFPNRTRKPGWQSYTRRIKIAGNKQLPNTSHIHTHTNQRCCRKAEESSFCHDQPFHWHHLDKAVVPILHSIQPSLMS